MDYIAIIHKDADSDYGISFPDFPGCITAGRTLDEAKNMASKALHGHVQILREEKQRLPVPSTMDQVMKHRNFRTGVALLVTLAEAERTVRINVTLTQNELQRIDRSARARGMSRSSFLVKNSLR